MPIIARLVRRPGAVLAAAGLLVLLAAPLAAQDYARSGVYVSAGGGFSAENFKRETDNGWNAQGSAGYRFHPNFAAEGTFVWADGFDGSSNSSPQTNEVQIWSLSANVKAFPWTGRVQPYGLAGAGVMEAEEEIRNRAFGNGTTNDTGGLLRFGGGIDFYVTEMLVLAVEGTYELPVGDTDDFDFWNVGGAIEIRF